MPHGIDDQTVPLEEVNLLEWLLKNALITAVLVAAFIVFCGLTAVGLDLMEYARQPAGKSVVGQIVQIAHGRAMSQIANDLANAGLIHSPLKFRLLARLKGCDKSLQAGEYLLSPAMTPLEMLDALVRGKVQLHRITIPEGYNLRQIGALLDAAGLVQAAAFDAAAHDKNSAARAGIAAASFEGYLFPDTYSFPKGTSATEIITAMKTRFDQVFKPEWRVRAEKMGWTVHQVVTLASIIEKETGEPAERPLISAVFHNRLRRGMRLETDPTVIYGIPDFDGNLTRRHLATETPYNTYRIAGLPPGPIANPGAEAIEAALYPSDSAYLFFVSRNDGTHHFSATLAEHQQAVRRYQLGR